MRRTGGTDPYRLREELQATMQALVGIFRTAPDLRKAIDTIGDLRERARDLCAAGGRAYNPGWNLVFELRNLIDISDAIAQSALVREESRGAHSRIDFPETLDDWATLNVVVRRDGDRQVVAPAPALPIPDDLQTLARAGAAH